MGCERESETCERVCVCTIKSDWSASEEMCTIKKKYKIKERWEGRRRTQKTSMYLSPNQARQIPG